MIGLDGIAVLFVCFSSFLLSDLLRSLITIILFSNRNVVSNPDEAAVNGRKKLQTRITHNDGKPCHPFIQLRYKGLICLDWSPGGSWKPMTPPSKDSLGQPYACTSTVSRSFSHPLQTHFSPNPLILDISASLALFISTATPNDETRKRPTLRPPQSGS
jgi:hypothetical protein